MRPFPSLALVAAALGALGACSSSEPLGQSPVERVLVVSMPEVSWPDVEAHDLPVLEDLVERAAIGDLSTRIGRRGASTTDAYLSIGAGTRAVAPRVDVAVALDPGEIYGGVPAAEILERRLGEVPDGLAYLAAGAAIDANHASSFGAEPGRLGDLLEAAGVDRAVIANADAAEGFVSDEPPPDGAYARSAVTALMGSDGKVPAGAVGRDLLVDDPLAPFGRRLDPGAVERELDEVWTGGRRVVLVEASDLSRASAYAPRSTPSQARALRAEALRDSDSLLGDLLARVDPSRDAVLVLSPVSRGDGPELGIALLAAPGVEPGLLRSSTTRRDGYVQLADVAPTVLALLGQDQPEEIEGRAFEVSPPGGYDRVERLVDGAEAATFRDEVIAAVVTTIIVGLAALAGASLAAARLPRQVRSWLRPLALGALGVVPATFLVPQLPGTTANLAAYGAAVLAGAALLGTGYALADRWRPGTGPLVATGSVVALIALDVVVGAPLQVNAVFGYSVSVAGRFAGLGNLAFALFGAATLVLGALLADRYGRHGAVLAMGLFVVVVLVEGLPMLGADVGGVASMVPSFGAAALILGGRRPTGRDAALLAAATLGTLLAFAFIDVGRPAGSRTHLARLAQHVLDRRWGPFSDTLSRRLQASFGGVDVALWALVGVLIAGVGAYAALVATGRMPPRPPATIGHRPTAAAGTGLAVLALVGLVANDSSIAVPATMLIIVVPVLVIRSLAPPGPLPARATR